MTEDDAIRRLEDLIAGSHDDYEAEHVFEDALMREALRALGWGRFVDAIEGADRIRWYA